MCRSLRSSPAMWVPFLLGMDRAAAQAIGQHSHMIIARLARATRAAFTAESGRLFVPVTAE